MLKKTMKFEIFPLEADKACFLSDLLIITSYPGAMLNPTWLIRKLQ